MCWGELEDLGWWPCLVVPQRNVLFLTPNIRPTRTNGNQVLVCFFDYGCLAFMESEELFHFFDAMPLKYLAPRSMKRRIENACEAALQYIGKELNENDRYQLEKNYQKMNRSRAIVKELELRSLHLLQQLKTRNNTNEKMKRYRKRGIEIRKYSEGQLFRLLNQIQEDPSDDVPVPKSFGKQRSGRANIQKISNVLPRRSARLKKIQEERVTSCRWHDVEDDLMI